MKTPAVPLLATLVVSGCVLLAGLVTLPLLILENASMGLWLMQIVPLMLVLSGVAKLNKRALQWLGFLIMFFLVQGILQMFVPLRVYQVLGTATTLTCLILFYLAIAGIRRPVNSENPS